MIRILVVLLVILGAWYVWRLLRREAGRVERDIDARRRDQSETLEKDPQDGRYKPRKPD